MDLRLMQVRLPVDVAPAGLGGAAVVVACMLGEPPRSGAAAQSGVSPDGVGHGPKGPILLARIAIDIDSTLHHYWDLFRSIVHERFGVDLAYEDQTGWGITRIPEDHLRTAVRETHSDENIAAGEPYPDAVETVREWHEAGHWIHITSHRAE